MIVRVKPEPCIKEAEKGQRDKEQKEQIETLKNPKIHFVQYPCYHVSGPGKRRAPKLKRK